MSAALSAADVARYHAEGYLLPDPPLRALSTDEAAAVRQQIEEVERETGVTANKALFMVRTYVNILHHKLATDNDLCVQFRHAWRCHDSLVCFAELI